VDVSISVAPVHDAAGRIIGASKIVRDITDRKLADATLRESEMRIRAILDSAVDAIITIDDQGRIQSINPATERLFGYGASEVMGRNVRMLMPEPYHSEHDNYIRNYILTGQARIIGFSREVTGKRKDGTTFPMSLAVNVVPLEGRRLFTGIVHDLTSRRELERRILEVSASEQRRIGQDLHDGLCQDLVGIAFQADAAARTLTAEGVNDVSAIDALAASVRSAAAQARRLSHGLNPVDLHAGGLPAALTALVGKINESFGIACAFDWDGFATVSDDSTATNLYRIAQEAISNAVKHGKARTIEVALKQQESSVVLSVADDGTGWKPGAKSDGIGLKGMQYRTNLLGGVLEIKTGRGSGTTITCSVRPVSSKPRRSPLSGRS
jgi:two-component system CheB/CheR fusion protein